MLSRGGHFSDEGYKYTSSDRQLIDALLYQGAENHHHNGLAGSIQEPDSELSLSLSTTGGFIPAGTRVYYKFTYVNANGQESAAGPETFIDTPDPVAEPGSPTLIGQSTGGVLTAGNYYYVLTAYVDDPIQETRATSPAYITIPALTQTNMITLELPTLPAGATGFNIYRRKPGQTKYFWLTNVDMNVATPPTEYVDNGGDQEDCDRTIPFINSTNSTNSILVSLPGATPAAPEGYTWKVYRTYINEEWTNSLLSWVVEYISEDSMIIEPTYLDVGTATMEGAPPLASQAIGSPDKVILTNMEEVQGTLPLGAGAYPFMVSFEFPGSITEIVGGVPWVCEFPRATIIGCRAFLGRDQTAGKGDTPTDVICDVNKLTPGATPVWETIYTTQANRPRIEVGEMIGERTVPDIRTLVEGEALTADIDDDGGTTGSDRHLTVQVYMIVDGFPTDTSFEFGTSNGVED